MAFVVSLGAVLPGFQWSLSLGTDEKGKARVLDSSRGKDDIFIIEKIFVDLSNLVNNILNFKNNEDKK